MEPLDVLLLARPVFLRRSLVMLEGELHAVALVRLREAHDVLRIERVAAQRVARVVEVYDSRVQPAGSPINGLRR